MHTGGVSMNRFSRALSAVLLPCLLLTGCVHQEDLDAWVGQPSAMLDRHPFFLTLPVVRTVTPDGTQIRNYVNGANISNCSGSGAIYGSDVSFATYNQFVACIQRAAACNNIFYIKDDRVVQYVPVGTGGVRCITDARLRPGFSGPGNFR